MSHIGSVWQMVGCHQQDGDNPNESVMLLHNYIYKISIADNFYFWQMKGVSVIVTSSKGNIFRVTDHLCGEFTGHRWIPRTKASDAELLCFLWSAAE